MLAEDPSQVGGRHPASERASKGEAIQGMGVEAALDVLKRFDQMGLADGEGDTQALEKVGTTSRSALCGTSEMALLAPKST